MNVSIISEETIKPSRPTPEHNRYLKASLFDGIIAPLFMPALFFYAPKSSSSKTTAFLDQLKTSLSTTLSIYYPLAGRVQKGNSVVCHDQGVPYAHAQVQATRLSDIIYKAEVQDLDKLLPYKRQERFSRKPLAIQVNTFACGGVAIGLKMNHAVSDGFSLLVFIQAWAAISNGKDPSLLPQPNFDICKLFPQPPSLVPDNREYDVFEEPNPELIMNRPMTKWFMFSEAKMDALRSKLYQSSQKPTSIPSKTTVLSAFLWSRIYFACKSRKIPQEVSVSVNVRPMVSVPKRTSFYSGNMVVNAIAELPVVPNDHTESLCRKFLARVHESKEKILNSGEFISNIKDGKEDLSFVTKQFERVGKGEIEMLMFSSLPGFPLYGADFGWGKSVWATTATMIMDYVLFIPAAPPSRDIIAYINLSGEDMIKLEADEEFSSYVSKKATLYSKM